MESQQLTLQNLAAFTGTDNWYRHPVVKRILYTDGIRHMMVKGAAYWLIDEIAFQQFHSRVRTEQFQVWTLTVNLEESTGTLTCDDGNGRVLCSNRYPTPTFRWQKLRSIFQMM